MTTAHDVDHPDLADVPAGPRIRRTASIGVATAAALLIWVIAHPVAGVDLIVGAGSSARTIGPVPVALTSIVAGLVAAGLAGLLPRVTSRPQRAWFVITVGVLILSLTGPLGAATVGAGLALAAMHLVVGVTLIVGISRTLRPEGRER